MCCGSPQGELDPSSVVVDCWGAGLPLDVLLKFYLPPAAADQAPPPLLGIGEGEAKVRGALLTP